MLNSSKIFFFNKWEFATLHRSAKWMEYVLYKETSMIVSSSLCITFFWKFFSLRSRNQGQKQRLLSSLLWFLKMESCLSIPFCQTLLFNHIQHLLKKFPFLENKLVIRAQRCSILNWLQYLAWIAFRDSYVRWVMNADRGVILNQSKLHINLT